MAIKEYAIYIYLIKNNINLNNKFKSV